MIQNYRKIMMENSEYIFFDINCDAHYNSAKS